LAQVAIGEQEQESKQVLNAVIQSKDLLIDRFKSKQPAELLNDKYESLYQKSKKQRHTSLFKLSGKSL
jgi:hypothetical protein